MPNHYPRSDPYMYHIISDTTQFESDNIIFLRKTWTEVES